MRVQDSIPTAPRLIEPLTQRELEVLALICDGLSNEEIAQFTEIALATVKYHLMNIYGKIGVRRRTQAVALAVHLDLVKPAWLPGQLPCVLPLAFDIEAVTH